MTLPSSRVSQLLTKLAVPPNKGLEWTAHSAKRDCGDSEIQNWPERFPDLWCAAAQAQAVRLQDLFLSKGAITRRGFGSVSFLFSTFFPQRMFYKLRRCADPGTLRWQITTLLPVFYQ
jgi:hypothetical protein